MVPVPSLMISDVIVLSLLSLKIIIWQRLQRFTDNETPFDLVPLGSIPELPAETCKEIKASEGEKAVSGKYWFDSIKTGNVLLAYCNMSTEGEFN